MTNEPAMESWGPSPINGRVAHLFTLKNSNGMTATITDWGATVIALTALRGIEREGLAFRAGFARHRLARIR